MSALDDDKWYLYFDLPSFFCSCRINNISGMTGGYPVLASSTHQYFHYKLIQLRGEADSANVSLKWQQFALQSCSNK